MDRFEDERGLIQDLLGPVDGVTEIFTRAGCVRGNHVHRETTQWTYVVYGRLLVSHAGQERVFAAGDKFVEPPGVPHAWLAMEDSCVLVFTSGPRSGSNFESDTERLPPEEHLLSANVCVACHRPGTEDAPLAVRMPGGKAHQQCPQPGVAPTWEGHWHTVAEYSGPGLQG